MSNKITGKIVMIAGIILVITGIVFIVLGILTRMEVVAGLEDEEITTRIGDSEEAVPVNDEFTAMNQVNIIKEHTLDRYGTYSSMERDDPNRETFIKGLTLRNALIIARMALQIALLVMGLGGLFILSGLPLTLVGLNIGKKE